MRTKPSKFAGGQTELPIFHEVEEGSFWTTGQRQAHSLHEVPYRACFKPQLPGYFIERFTKPGDCVLDPFMGRGTTLLTAALAGRVPAGFDANPLCTMLLRPRLNPPAASEVAARLQSFRWDSSEPHDEDLLAYYHPETLRQLLALRRHLLDREQSGDCDPVDQWIRMVALTRLTGHSRHFFSVYTLPPNQATYPERQRRINAKLKQQPEPRDVSSIILRKTQQLTKDCSAADLENLRAVSERTVLAAKTAEQAAPLSEGSVDLVVTSPPFLTEVDYKLDNWLRCWFAGIDPSEIPMSLLSGVPDWQEMMYRSLQELRRVARPGAHIVVEVGEVKKGSIKLEEPLCAAAVQAGLVPEKLFINRQSFTKTSNCWGIKNNEKGTNTNRIAVFLRP